MSDYVTANNDTKRHYLLARLVDSPYAAMAKQLGKHAILNHLVPWLSEKLQKRAMQNGWTGHLARAARTALQTAREMGMNMDPVHAE